MRKCNFCNLKIKDMTSSCPLCGGVLEGTDVGEMTYPNVFKRTKAINIIFRVLLFLSIVSVIICVQVNYHTDFSFKWSLIVAMSLLFALWLIYLFTKEGAGYRLRTFGGVMAGVILVVFIDYLCGFNRWSINYVFPATIITVDAVLLLLMLINRRNFQSYTLLIGGLFLISLIPPILYLRGIVTDYRVAHLAAIIVFITLLGVVILGGSRVKQELKRRFYIGG